MNETEDLLGLEIEDFSMDPLEGLFDAPMLWYNSFIHDIQTMSTVTAIVLCLVVGTLFFLVLFAGNQRKPIIKAVDHADARLFDMHKADMEMLRQMHVESLQAVKAVALASFEHVDKISGCSHKLITDTLHHVI